jgi:hypothetical protein
MQRLLYFFILLLLFSCTKKEERGYSGVGLQPVYLTLSEWRELKNLPPQPIEKTGSIVLAGQLFFMAEAKKGIHIFDLEDSTQTKLTFIQIPALEDFTLFDHYLYAFSWTDLVTIDISDIYQVKEISRQANAYEPAYYPINYSGIFECVDPAKGAVGEWKETQLEDVMCSTFF